MSKTVFVISDLHIGGAPPSPGRPRGFRICTEIDALATFVTRLPALTSATRIELVVNGDFVDFLAEETHEGTFVPFILDEARAVVAFDVIVENNRSFFAALKTHLTNGHELTILAGNHDLELAYPAVERRLREVLGDPKTGLTLILDGTPYRLENAIIEHGHQYDGWNAVHPEQVRALIDHADETQVASGSRLVAQVMNPTKRTWAFVDLLKPEVETVVPVLLALDSSVASIKRIGTVIALARRARHAQVAIDRALLLPVAAMDGPPEPTPREEVNEVLARLLGSEEAAEAFFADIKEDVRMLPVGAQSVDEVLDVLERFLGSPKRIRALYRALDVLQRDLSFERSVEHDPRYVAAAEARALEASYLVMGHTHLAKEHRDIVPGCTYFNSGTWADLIPFPDLFSGTEQDGIDQCTRFVSALRDAQSDPSILRDWIAFRPTYVQLECDGPRVVSGSLRTFEESAREPKAPRV